MRVYVQWALASPADWQPVDVTAAGAGRRVWERLPSKPAPTSPAEDVDDVHGWINDINCQGISFAGYDHYAVEPIGDGLRVTSWQDSADFPAGIRYATVWQLMPPAPDPNLGGQINTVQVRTFYVEDSRLRERLGVAGIPFRAWAEFSPPSVAITRHGKWLSDELFTRHQAAQSLHGWREWAP